MRNQKIMVNQERVKRLLDDGKSCNGIAHKFGYPVSVIYRIRDGLNVPYFFRKPKREHRPQVEGKCTCCRIRDKAPGMRYLCDYCFQYADSGEIYPETSINCRI